MYTFALLLLDLTFREIVADIPHTFPAFVIYAIIALFVAGIWYGSRGKTGVNDGPTDHVGDHP
jgi:hypothetical protein